ncbi:GNAT family N-acetyltransferase [Ktedonospora formicarum]|uniref:N-acetyltransferase domain-containing protein n=1 Tax=Ktedonospora formicarum TaxID=2778364 RepID=A0A8J3MTE8_9CHLR|nr:GNAT family N-acetyltransferase [Ktedonospora formicarum]GHO48162.1 hypothetical protein KSX_63250 [Ktedonospora formicarum]
MALGTWWRGDTLPQLSTLPSFSAGISTDKGTIARMNQLTNEEIERRFDQGHFFYLAYMDETPAGYGWVATREGSIRELQLRFPISPRERYLWDFQTLPEWRGRGIYPHLLQTIILQELLDADRFWIGFKPDNEASERGITKAGFQIVGDFVFGEGPEITFGSYDNHERGLAAARFYHLPLTTL